MPNSLTTGTLTGSRVLAVCVFCFLFLLLCRAERAAALLEELDQPRLAETLRSVAKATGLAALSEGEARLVTELRPKDIIGTVEAPAASPLPPEPPRPQVAPEPPKAEPAAVEKTKAGTKKAGKKNRKKGGRGKAGQAQAADAAKSAENPGQADPKAVPAEAPRHRVLLVGDSMMMEGLGPALFRTLGKDPGIELTKDARYSTGLSREDYFDWPARLEELIRTKDPDVVVVCLGANDGQDILTGKKRHITGTFSWQVLYRQRADRFVDTALSRGARLVWIGLPVMGKEPYSSRIRLLSALQQAACGRCGPRALFVDTVPMLADARGRFQTYGLDKEGRQIRLRRQDAVHLTEEGGRILVEKVLPDIRAQLAAGRLPPDEIFPPIPEN